MFFVVIQIYYLFKRTFISFAFDETIIMIFVFSLIVAIVTKKNFHENLKFQLLASFSCNRVFLNFSMIINLFNEQIERRMLIMFLNKKRQLHKYIKAIEIIM